MTGLCAASADGTGGQPWQSWVPVVENPFVAGEFIWTGFDYRGEPNPFSWPAVTSQTGAMDLCGFPKPVYYYWKAAWERKPLAYFTPHWSFPQSAAGEKVSVRVFSNCEQVELSLNGKSLGEQQMPPEQYVDWQVPYAPGELTAVCANHGHEAARYAAETTGVPEAIRLAAEVQRLAADGEEIAPIRVEVVDAEGRVVPDADNQIQFSISGAGTLAGVRNGDPASHESNVGNQRTAFHGLCLALVRAADQPGAITIRAEGKGLRPARLVIRTSASGAPPGP